MKLSAFIQNNTEAIVQEFEQFARSIQPKTGDLDKITLRDHVKLMLENIVDDIDSLESKSEQVEKSKGQNLKSAIATAAQEHGKERMHLGFDIISMIAEYRFLRATIIRLWSEHRSIESLDNYDIIRFNEALDQLICEAVDSFAAETQRQARRFDTVLSSSSDHGYILDLEGKFVYANKPMLQVLNSSLDELVGKSHSDFNFCTASEIDSNLKQVIQSAENCSGEVKYTLPSGEERQYEYVFSPVVDDQKKIEAVAATERDVTDRNRAEEKIKKSLAEKEVLLKEIHHRVKNNLQVISSLVSLQANNLTDERMSEEFHDVQDRVRSMALIHEKLYQTGDLARLNFSEYATTLLHTLWRSHGTLAAKVRINLALSPVELSIEAAVPCGLILNELAGNALKHAFPNSSGGEVTVGPEHDAATDAVCLRVHDNGVGLPAGLDCHQPTSLGLHLVRILAGQLRGTVETETGTGTEFRVTFPMKGFQV